MVELLAAVSRTKTVLRRRAPDTVVPLVRDDRETRRWEVLPVELDASPVRDDQHVHQVAPRATLALVAIEIDDIEHDPVAAVLGVKNQALFRILHEHNGFILRALERLKMEFRA